MEKKISRLELTDEVLTIPKVPKKGLKSPKKPKKNLKNEEYSKNSY